MDKYLQGIRPYILLTLFCLVVFFCGIASVPVMDRDEARFVQATRQMLETNDFVKIRYQNVARNKKPAGIYWLQSLSVSAFGDFHNNQVWPYRIPSAVGAWLAVMLTFLFGQILFNRKTAFLACFFLSSSILLATEAHLAKTDAMLLAVTVLTMGSLSIIYFKERNIYEIDCSWCKEDILAFLFWLGLGLSVLIKGPLVPIIVILAVGSLILFEKRAKWLMSLKPLLGIMLFSLIVFPWFYLINKATDGHFIKEAFLKDMLPKIMGGAESHGAYPGLYFLIVNITFWPASLYLWPAIIGAKRDIENPATRFCVAWALPAWVMFELVPTKLPHYVLPLYPAIALLIAQTLMIAWRNTDALFIHKIARIWFVIWGSLGIFLAVGFIYLSKEYGRGLYYPWAWLSSLFAVLATYFALKERKRLSYFHSGIWASFWAGLMFATVFSKLMPSLDYLWISRRVAEKIAVLDKKEEAFIIAVGYHEPSLVFMLGTDTVLSDIDEAVALLAKNWHVIAIIADDYTKKFNEKITKEKIKTYAYGGIEGLNYSRGKKTFLKIYSNYQAER